MATSTSSTVAHTAVVSLPSPDYATLHADYTRLAASHTLLTTLLKTLQEAEYLRARHTRLVVPHRTTAGDFTDLFNKITSWARDYFRRPLRALPPHHHLFRQHVARVAITSPRKSKLNVSHLVQAVAADIVARRVIAIPFPGCSEEARAAFTAVYNGLLNSEGEGRARRWAADTFVAYTRGRERVGTAEVLAELEEVLGPVAASCCPGHDVEERTRRAKAFVAAAERLADVLAAQAARLQVLDCDWFRGQGGVFVGGDRRMEGRLGDGEGEEEAGVEWMVDTVLRPGFLKWGNDEAENMGQWSVWIPALVEVIEEGTEDEEESEEESDVSDEDESSPEPTGLSKSDTPRKKMPQLEPMQRTWGRSGGIFGFLNTFPDKFLP